MLLLEVGAVCGVFRSTTRSGVGRRRRWICCLALALARPGPVSPLPALVLMGDVC